MLGFLETNKRLGHSKKQKNNTRDSNVVPHRSTNLARQCLTSLSRREAVLSLWYGRSYLRTQIWLTEACLHPLSPQPQTGGLRPLSSVPQSRARQKPLAPATDFAPCLRTMATTESNKRRKTALDIVNRLPNALMREWPNF